MELKRFAFTFFILCSFALMHAQVQTPIELVEVADGFDKPVDMTHAGDDRLFVVEKEGVIRILNSDGSINPSPFLDMQTLTSTGGLNSERGLLGLTFHPDYMINGYFYVNYTMVNGDTRISRFTVSADPDVADAASRVDLLTIDQPYGNHNGGCLKFGPDGYLYIGMGDGGSGEDPDNYGQNMGSLLGKMLRIDVDGASPYEVPASNPYVATGVDTLPEIWAAGLRNPWRFSFDRLTGDLWMGDVGQYQWEEIDFQSASSTGGENYGWRCYEGNHPGFGSNCPPLSEFAGPVSEFSHSDGHCSVTGGYVYRGSEFPALAGKYFYTDYCSGQFWSLEQNDADEWVVFEVTGTLGFGWTSFGENSQGELFVVNQSQGSVYQIIDPCLDIVATIMQSGNTLTSELMGTSYQWYLNNVAIDGATEETYVITEDGEYRVLVVTAEGCNSFSEGFTAVVSSVIAVEGDFGVSLVENPVTDQLRLSFAEGSDQGYTVLVQDMAGRQLLNKVIPAGVAEWSVDVSALSPGNYIMSIRAEKGEHSIRFTRLR